MQMAQFVKGHCQYVDYTPAADVNPGDVVVDGDTLLICTGGNKINGGGTGISANRLGAMVCRGGTFLVKADGAIGKRKEIFWDAVHSKITLTRGTNKRFGFMGDQAAAADGDMVPAEFAPSPAPIGVTAGMRVAFGQATTVTATDTIVTGLATVVAVVACEDSDPTDDPQWFTASAGNQTGAPAAGSFILKSWKNTGGTDPTPLAATTFGKKVNWIAIGT